MDLLVTKKWVKCFSDSEKDQEEMDNEFDKLVVSRTPCLMCSEYILMPTYISAIDFIELSDMLEKYRLILRDRTLNTLRVNL